MLPHFHLSGLHGLTVFLFVVVAFGTSHLVAASHPESTLARGWVSLGF